MKVVVVTLENSGETIVFASRRAAHAHLRWLGLIQRTATLWDQGDHMPWGQFAEVAVRTVRT